jgi:plastocyanin
MPRFRTWRRAIAFFITVTLAAVPVLPVRAADTEVNIDNFAFTPKELTVKAGTTIVFRNRDDIPHSVVGSNGEFHSKALDTDEVFYSPSPRLDPTPILVACIRKCRAGSWSRLEARGIIASA